MYRRCSAAKYQPDIINYTSARKKPAPPSSSATASSPRAPAPSASSPNATFHPASMDALSAPISASRNPSPCKPTPPPAASRAIPISRMVPPFSPADFRSTAAAFLSVPSAFRAMAWIRTTSSLRLVPQCFQPPITSARIAIPTRVRASLTPSSRATL